MHIMEQNDRAVAIGETVEIALDTSTHLVLFHGFLQRRSVRFGNIDLGKISFRFHGSAAGRLPQMVKAYMGSNPIQPGSLSSCLSKRIAMMICTQEGLLGQVFRGSCITHHAHNVPKYSLVIPLEKDRGILYI